jgi:mannose-6-phosphate isomerase-like protein (cupin superfamily)
MSEAVFHIAEAPRRTMRYDRGVMIQLVDERLGARNVDVHVNVLRPGSAPGPYHYHERAENVYLVISGTARIVVEGKEYLVGPRQVVFIPPGLKHSTSNAGPAPLEILEIYAPAGSDFHEVAG